MHSVSFLCFDGELGWARCGLRFATLIEAGIPVLTTVFDVQSLRRTRCRRDSPNPREIRGNPCEERTNFGTEGERIAALCLIQYRDFSGFFGLGV